MGFWARPTFFLEEQLMHSKFVLVGSLIAAALVAGACGGSSTGLYGSASTPTPTTAPTTGPTAAPVAPPPSANPTPPRGDRHHDRRGQHAPRPGSRRRQGANALPLRGGQRLAVCLQQQLLRAVLATRADDRRSASGRRRERFIARHHQAAGRDHRGHLRRPPALLLHLRQEGG